MQEKNWLDVLFLTIPMLCTGITLRTDLRTEVDYNESQSKVNELPYEMLRMLARYQKGRKKAANSQTNYYRSLLPGMWNKDTKGRNRDKKASTRRFQG